MIKQSIEPDALAELGALALGSRLRRLADRLYGQAAASLDSEGIDLSPNHIPVLMTLYTQRTMTVAELSRRLRTSQPGISRMLSDLKAKRIVSLKRSTLDQRQTDVSLSTRGVQLMARLANDYCRRVEASATELFATTTPDFLQQLSAIESILAHRGLDERIAAKRRAQDPDETLNEHVKTSP